MALTNSPAYPVTTKSSSQKLCYISEGTMVGSKVLFAHLDLAVTSPKAEGNGLWGYETENDILDRYPVASEHQSEALKRCTMTCGQISRDVGTRIPEKRWIF